MSEARRYRPRGVYRGLTLLGFAVCLLFGWELARAFSWATLFFLLIALFFALTNLRWSASPVDVSESGLLCHRPPAAPLAIGFRQIADCQESGRRSNAISLIYYPVTDGGMLDLDTPRSCFLPSVEDQEQLVATIQQRLVD